MVDPIADLLTRIRNASAVRKAEVILPYSKIKFEMVNLLEREGLIEKAEITEADSKKNKDVLSANFKQIKIILKYSRNGQPAITNLKRVSTPGRRIYVKKGRAPRVLDGLGISILTTSKGIMTNKEAYKKGLGGELICQIW
ncbi:MAG: 30S ribosomal protein S8 [Patescibacteria group bacterium]